MTRHRHPLLAASLLLCWLGGCAGTVPVPLPADAAPIEGPNYPDGLFNSDLVLWFDGPGPACGPASCSGCCTSDGLCVPGTGDAQCGKDGYPCADCTTVGAACKDHACESCVASCGGVPCGSPDGCGGTCQPGSGCCTASCTGKICGDPDGCGGTCQPGSGCCSPSCSGAACGDSDGCGGSCAGSCPPWESCTNYVCTCGPAPHFQRVNGVCLPSCGGLLAAKGLPDAGGGCCPSGCQPGMLGGGPGETHDCNYCCSSLPGVVGCL